MGFDVSYHPISPERIQRWYFDSLSSDDHALALCGEFDLDNETTAKFLNYLPTFRKDHRNSEVDKTDGFAIAVTHGFFAEFHYVRGCMLSEVDVGQFGAYTQPWRELFPDHFADVPAADRIIQNYSSGVFIPASRVRRLLEDLEDLSGLHTAVTEQFPGEHFEVLYSALLHAERLGAGLLEATDVIEPNPLSPGTGTCLSRFENCDSAGLQLFSRTASDQLASLGVPADANVTRLTVNVDSDADQLIRAPSGPTSVPMPPPSTPPPPWVSVPTGSPPPPPPTALQPESPAKTSRRRLFGRS